MANVFVKTNMRRFMALRKRLTEYNFSGAYGGNLDLLEIISVIDNLINEVNKSDALMELKENQIKRLTAELETLKKTVNNFVDNEKAELNKIG